MQLRSWLDGLRTKLTGGTSAMRRRRTRVSRRLVEALEDRTLLSSVTAIVLVEGELTVLADSGEDLEIREDPLVPGQVELLVDGQPDTSIPSTLTTSSLVSIEIVTGEGDNLIDLSGINSLAFTALESISVDAGEGDDQVIASADFDDVIDGGHGSDTLFGGTGDNVLSGGHGDDLVVGGAGRDQLYGNDGQDQISGGDGDDTISGGDGQDSLFGDLGNDRVSGNHDTDLIRGGGGNDTLNGGAGNDTINGDLGEDVILGGSGGDRISGGAGYDLISGQGGNDSLSGGSEHDTLNGGSGSDQLQGDAGNDRLNGGDNADTLLGSDGDDSLYGGPGGDLLEGNLGDDVMRGQGGHDVLFGGIGFDHMDGGAGNDQIDAEDQWTLSIGDATVNPEGSDDNSAVAFYSDFETGLPTEFTQVANSSVITDVQGYDGLGSGLNTFSGSFLHNTTGGTAGLPGSQPSEPITLVLSDLPEHTSLDLNFLLAIIENWDGNTSAGDAQGDPVDYPDSFSVAVDGGVVYSVAFDQQLTGDTYDLLADDVYAAANGVLLQHNRSDLFTPAGGNHPIYINDSAWDLGIDASFDAISHTASTATIQFYAGGAGYQGGDDESWAIDNVEVILNGLTDQTDATLTVTLSRPQEQVVSVNYSTTDGTASVVTEDYLPTSGKLVFAPGELTRTFTVSVQGDTEVEGDETFGVVLSGARNARITGGQGTVTIVDDDSGASSLVMPIFAADTGEEYMRGILDPILAEYSARYRVAPRWGTTATDGSGLQQGDPTTLTWNIVPDGTGIPALSGINGESTADSDLIDRLDTIYNETASGPDITNRTWFPTFAGIFDRWGELSGITYIREPNDDSVAFSSANSNPGVAGVRADLRIGGHSIDGNFSVLAYNFFPDHGDMVIDTNDTSYDNVANNSRLLRNVLGHENGHGLGFSHVIPINESKLMEPIASTQFDGPQYDDILAIHRSYGDFHESGTGNDTSITAMDLGQIDNTTVSLGADTALQFDGDGDGEVDNPVDPASTNYVSSDGSSDIDFYRFSALQGATLSLALQPIGPTYDEGPQGGSASSFDASNQADLTLELLDSDGTTVLASADTGGVGQGESIPSTVLTAGGVYYVRVTSPTDLVQTYQLDVTLAGGSGGPGGPGGPGGNVPGLIGDTLLGSSGQDTLVGSGDADLLNGGGGADLLKGRAGNDSLYGGGGNDLIHGGPGNDVLQGQGGIDSLHGDSGDDQLVWRLGDSSDLLDGGPDADLVHVLGDSRNNQVSVSQSVSSQLQISDTSGTITIEDTISRVQVDAGAGRDTVSIGTIDRVSTVMLTVYGQGGRDTIDAGGRDLGAVRLLVDGGSGNDTITGSNEDDSLLGGAGADVVLSRGGDDTVHGGSGNDSLDGGAGEDELWGGGGHDVLEGRDGRDELDGGDGNDLLIGHSGDDTLDGSAGNDTLNGSSGNDRLNGDAGRDTLLGGGGDDTLNGGTDDDFLVGNAGDDVILAGHGNDRASGGSGADSILGDDGHDTLDGGSGNDLLAGGDGSDRLNSRTGDDTLLGGDGEDTLLGGNGRDLLLGGDNDDFLNGQGGIDTLATGQGNDNIGDGSDDDVINEAFTEAAFESLLDQLEAL